MAWCTKPSCLCPGLMHRGSHPACLTLITFRQCLIQEMTDDVQFHKGHLKSLIQNSSYARAYCLMVCILQNMRIWQTAWNCYRLCWVSGKFYFQASLDPQSIMFVIWHFQDSELLIGCRQTDGRVRSLTTPSIMVRCSRSLRHWGFPHSKDVVSTWSSCLSGLKFIKNSWW